MPKMMKCRCVFCALIALLVVCVAALGAQSTQPATEPAEEGEAGENLVEFVSEKYGFRLMFPDWLRKVDAKQPPGVVLVLLRMRPDPAGTQAQIMVVSPPDIRAGLGLEDSAQAYLEAFKRAFSAFKVLETRQATLDGEDAKVYVVQGNQLQGGREVKLQIVLALRNDRLYSLIALAEPAGFDSLSPTFQRVLESFRWTK